MWYCLYWLFVTPLAVCVTWYTLRFSFYSWYVFMHLSPVTPVVTYAPWNTWCVSLQSWYVLLNTPDNCNSSRNICYLKYLMCVTPPTTWDARRYDLGWFIDALRAKCQCWDLVLQRLRHIDNLYMHIHSGPLDADSGGPATVQCCSRGKSYTSFRVEVPFIVKIYVGWNEDNLHRNYAEWMATQGDLNTCSGPIQPNKTCRTYNPHQRITTVTCS